MRRSLLALGIAALAATAAMPSASSTPGARAKASWSMVDMSKDVNHDGFIDGDGGVPKSGALSLAPSATFVGEGNHLAQPNERLINGAMSWYLSPSGFPVTLNACGSVGSTFAWTLTDTATTATTRLAARRLTARTCRTRVTLPEGNYTFALSVASGSATSTESMAAQVKNILMLALGDSYASGEGNPRNVGAWLRRDGLLASFHPYWDQDSCHRSVHGAPAQAALALEQHSLLTSVTLVDVTCSGATVRQGILGAQPSMGQTQIALARSLIGTAPVDLVTLSVGGNDVGFGSVLSSCLLNANCPLVPASPGTLQRYPTLQAGVTDQTAKLPAAYADVAACLAGRTCPNGVILAPGALVLPTLYPDISRNSDGSICSYLSMNTQDFTWARASILNPAPPPSVPYLTTNQGAKTLPIAATLNQQIRNTSSLGWRPVVQTWSKSGDSNIGHGICAGATSWVFGVQLGSEMVGAAFHPNPTGQRELAAAITEAAKPAVG
ncbi:MAG: SGNH/GDSL hydrolase family protein [Candidatus Nanopelagicales bacterium]